MTAEIRELLELAAGRVSCSASGGPHHAESFANHPSRQAARMTASTRCAAEIGRRM